VPLFLFEFHYLNSCAMGKLAVQDHNL